MKPWFSLYDHKKYNSNIPHFINVSDIDGIKHLEDNYGVIVKELMQYLETHAPKSHFSHMMVTKPDSWKIKELRIWGVDMYETQRHFKETIQLLDQIPNVINFGINFLSPHSNITPHSGDTDAIYRCHLGIKVPEPAPTCALKVNGEIKGWAEGKVISFIDAYEHEAWNHSHEDRIILLFDILRPEFSNQKLKICATVLTSIYVQTFLNKFHKTIIKYDLMNKKRKFLKLILFPAVLFLMISIPVRNWLKKP